jgi:ribose 1,5-bisphosphokinase
MNRQLIYVVGPSGAGKDSLMRWLRERSVRQPRLHWARRTVTRPSHDSSTGDISLDEASFSKTVLAGGFALQWQANGLRYGIPHEELTPILTQQWVFINGSRAHLETCAARYPGMTILHITADPAVLRQRLLQRGRESQTMVETRIQRAPLLAAPAQSILMEVFNNSDIEEAGQQMLQQLERLPGWPFP